MFIVIFWYVLWKLRNILKYVVIMVKMLRIKEKILMVEFFMFWVIIVKVEMF